jgi:hypothetical protein
MYSPTVLKRALNAFVKDPRAKIVIFVVASADKFPTIEAELRKELGNSAEISRLTYEQSVSNPNLLSRGDALVLSYEYLGNIGEEAKEHLLGVASRYVVTTIKHFIC